MYVHVAPLEVVAGSQSWLERVFDQAEARTRTQV
jgi:hypothetical protein